MRYLCCLFLFTVFGVVNAQTECNFWSDEWYLKIINIDGITYNLNSNEEVVNATLECPLNPEGNFITTFCETGVGVIEDNGVQITFVDDIFNVSGDSCEVEINETLEDLYFSFFTNNSDQPFDYFITIIDFIPPPGPDSLVILRIIAPNGDYVEYDDYPQELLNLDRFDTIKISLSPNPTSDTVFIESSNNEELLIETYDFTGKFLENIKIEQKGTISLASYAEGIYFFKVKDSFGNSKIERIVKK